MITTFILYFNMYGVNLYIYIIVLIKISAGIIRT